LAFLFFLAGFEIDLEQIRGRPLNLGVVGWLLSLVLAFVLAGTLHLVGITQSPLYVALAVATTAVGTLLPMLHDAGEIDTAFGRYVLAAGAIGEFGPIVLIALLLDQQRKPVISGLVLNGFVVLVVAGVLVVRRWQPARVHRLVKETMHSSAQLAIRLSIVILALFVFAAVQFGLEFLLGAFAAGVVIAQSITVWGDADQEDVDSIRGKYEALGFGFLIPIFFVVSGTTFDLEALLAHGESLLLVPLFLLVFLAVRGIPAILLCKRDLATARGPLALLCATELPLVIAITDLALANHSMTELVATCLVGAAMLSVLLFPLVALTWKQRLAPALPPEVVAAN
jgi:Kef-type K+ transport system membrane component KefB